MRKYWTKARSKTSWVNSNLCISMSDDKMLFWSPTPFSFVNCSKLLSYGLIPFSTSNFPWQVSNNSGISNILGSSRQSRLQLHRFTQWPLWGSIQDTPDTCLTSADFGSHGGIFCIYFLLSLTLKPEPYGWSCQVLLMGSNYIHVPLVQLYLH